MKKTLKFFDKINDDHVFFVAFIVSLSCIMAEGASHLYLILGV